MISGARAHSLLNRINNINMKNEKVRSIVAVIIGLTAAIVVVMFVDYFSSRLHGGMEGIDYNDKAAMKEFMQSLSVGLFIFHLAGYALAAAVGAFVTNKMTDGNRYRPFLVTGALFIVLTILNMINIWHPTWFWIASIPLWTAAGWFGGKLALAKN